MQIKSDAIKKRCKKERGVLKKKGDMHKHNNGAFYFTGKIKKEHHNARIDKQLAREKEK